MGCVENIKDEGKEMKVIYKYPILVGSAHIYLNEDAELLSVGIQKDKIVIWAIVDPEKSFLKLFIFHCYNTGGPSREKFLGEYFGTVTSSNGIVWHVFVEEVK